MEYPKSRKELKAKRNQLRSAAEQLAGVSGREIDFAVASEQALALDQARKALPRPLKVREKSVYDRDSGNSILLDTLATTSGILFPGMPNQNEAQLRLANYYRVDVPAAQKKSARRMYKELDADGINPMRDGAKLSERALSTGAASAGAFVPPAFALEDFYGAAKQAGVIQAIGRVLPLPPSCDQVVVPGLTPAGSTDPNANAEFATNQPGVTTTSSLWVGVRQYSAITKLSLALWDRSTILETVLAQDAAESLAEIITCDACTGSGLPEATLPGVGTVAGELLGYTSVGTVVTYTDSTPSVSLQLDAISLGLQTASAARNRPSQCLLMPPTLATSISLSHSSTGYPLQAVGIGDGDIKHSADVLTYIGGYPVYGVPSLVEDGVSQVLCVRPASDDLLFVGDPVFSVYDETYADQLSVLYIVRQYVAFAIRRPSSVVVVTGTGFAV
jgi:HK97 family phage major capsid protein